jgi:UDP-GlcNAc:undecaprenyl-phosphate GlcNAc-1-phosphate transferase
MIFPAVIAAAFALGLNLVVIPTILRLAHRFKWYDLPDHRKIHTGLIPRLGGPGMYLSFLCVALLTPILVTLITGGTVTVGYTLRFIALFLGVSLIQAIGLIDDFRPIKALLKFFLQMLAAIIVTAGGFLIRSVTLPYLGSLGLGLFAYPITVLWLVGISNAVNLIDGMDGLAGGISAFAALSMGIIALIQGSTVTSVLCFALFGAILGFLVFNFPPAKIFMGDSGSLFLGFCLAVFPLVGGISKVSAFGTLLVPVTLLTIPILDISTSVIRRLRNKVSIIHPDKEHIHHKLLDMGLNQRQILWVLYGFSLYLSVVAITSVILPREINVYLIFVVWVGSLLGYGLLYYVNTRQRSASTGEEVDKGAEESSARGFPKSG